MDSLRAFAAAARTGSFKRAARELHVSPSALSRRIQALEDHLGIPLFSRLNPGLELTESGERYRQAVERALAPLETAQQELVEPDVRVLRVSSLASFTESWLVPHLPEFERAHPELRIEIEATLRYADFQRDRVDAAIRFGTGPWEGLHSDPLLALELFPVCAPELASADPPLRVPADLAEHTLIHRTHLPDAWSWWLREAGLAGLVPRREVTYDHIGIALSAAESGQGVALGSPLHCERRLREGRLVRPFPLSVRSPVTYHFVCRPESLRDPPIAGAARLAAAAAGVTGGEGRVARRASASAEIAFAGDRGSRTVAACDNSLALESTGSNGGTSRSPASRPTAKRWFARSPSLAVTSTAPSSRGRFPSEDPSRSATSVWGRSCELGDDVRGLEIGQRVVVAFQLSCGRCPSCARGHTANCDAYPVLSDYGMQPLSGVEYGGMLSERILVPFANAMLQPLAPGLDPVSLASVSDNVLDGYRAVAPHLRARPGSDVLIVSHGGRRASRSTRCRRRSRSALRASTSRATTRRSLALAERLGARPLRTDFGQRQRRYPIVVDAGTHARRPRLRAPLHRARGALSERELLSGARPDALGRLYTLGVRFLIGRCHAAALLPEVLRTGRGGRLQPGEVTTRIVDWEDAPKAFPEPAIKLVVRRD